VSRNTASEANLVRAARQHQQLDHHGTTMAPNPDGQFRENGPVVIATAPVRPTPADRKAQTVVFETLPRSGSRLPRSAAGRPARTRWRS
jgi:hypothetical protein